MEHNGTDLDLDFDNLDLSMFDTPPTIPTADPTPPADLSALRAKLDGAAFAVALAIEALDALGAGTGPSTDLMAAMEGIVDAAAEAVEAMPTLPDADIE